MNKNIKENLESKKVNNQSGNNILPFDKLEEFIENVSNIDLEEYKTKILLKEIWNLSKSLYFFSNLWYNIKIFD